MWVSIPFGYGIRIRRIRGIQHRKEQPMLRYVSPVAEQTADVYWSGEALWICSVGAAIAASTFFQLLGVTIAAFLKYFFLRRRVSYTRRFGQSLHLIVKPTGVQLPLLECSATDRASVFGTECYGFESHHSSWAQQIVCPVPNHGLLRHKSLPFPQVRPCGKAHPHDEAKLKETPWHPASSQ